MENQIAKNLIDALHEVSELDIAHSLYSNPTVDRVAPWLGTWMVELINAERTARDAPNGAEVEFTMVDLSQLPLVELQAGHGVAVGCVKAAYGLQIETVSQFAFRVLEMFVAELYGQLAVAVELGLLETKSNG